MSEEQGQEPRIHVDSDWKSQAQAEKDKLKEMDVQSQAGSQQGRGELPPAEFKTLVGTLASNAVMSLGGMQHPETGQVMVDIEGAKLYIDLLDILQEKTSGNLDDEESQYLEQVAHELRTRFVEISRAVAEQMSGGGQGGQPGGDQPPAAGPGPGPAGGAGGGSSPIIQP